MSGAEPGKIGDIAQATLILVQYFGLRAAEHLQLWWWTGMRWDYISIRSHCMNMPHGSMFARCGHCRQQVVWLAGDGPGRICHNDDPACFASGGVRCWRGPRLG